LTRSASIAQSLWAALATMSFGMWVGWSVRIPLIAIAMTIFMLVACVAVFPRFRVTILLLAAALLVGIALAATRASRQSALLEMASAFPECEVRGRVTEVAGLGTFARIEEAACEGFEPVIHPGTLVVEDDNLKPGQFFDARGRIHALSDDPFDVARTRLGADGIFYPDRTRAEDPTGPSGAPFSFRDSMTESATALDSRAGALLLGLTIGDTSGFDEDTLENFRRSGLSHLLAVSGSNVAIVVGSVALCVARASLSTRLVSCGGTLAFYVLVVGPDPSVLRAAAMGMLGLMAMVWGHRPEALSALALALIITLAFRPAFLFSVGLHLSAGATAGLVLWSRPFARRLGYRMPTWVAWPLGATLAAQVAVAPLLGLTFGEVSVVAPLANVAALPAVAPATILGLVAALVGLFSDAAGSVVAALASPLAAWVVYCAETLGRPEWSQAPVPKWLAWSGLGIAAAAAVMSSRGVRGVN
jgi:ComEC/Rec2-related protein